MDPRSQEMVRNCIGGLIHCLACGRIRERERQAERQRQRECDRERAASRAYLQVNMQRQGLAVQARRLIVTARPAGVEIAPGGVPLTFRVTDTRRVSFSFPILISI